MFLFTSPRLIEEAATVRGLAVEGGGAGLSRLQSLPLSHMSISPDKGVTSLLEAEGDNLDDVIAEQENDIEHVGRQEGGWPSVDDCDVTS